jgi:FtsP/CotA-like multicopper oxidase with cupredoxin domain
VPLPPEPWESGRKDTVIAYPGQVTRLRLTFLTPGQYVWHCHIVEHEDNEMMRPYRIGPIQPGQPDPA